MNFAERRILFYETLKEGLDHKTVWSGTDNAVERLSAALRIAAESPRLEEPLVELASYRLAHAKLRNASSIGDFYEVNRLLEEAIRPQGNLSIMPRILQLAVHHRLSCIDPNSDPDEAQDGKDAVWKNVIDAVRQATTDDYKRRPTETNSLLQSVPVSMAELAAYFSGCDLAPLDGAAPIDQIEDLYRGLSGHRPFVVCANDDPELDLNRRIPEDIAIEMVENRLERGMADIGFVINEDTGYAFFKGGKELTSKKVVLLFGYVLGVLSRDQVKHALDTGTLKHYRDRMDKKVREQGLADNAICYDPSSKTYSFAPGLRVVGAVSRKLRSQELIADNWG